MKYIILLTLFILTSIRAAHAEEQYTRVGVALGCTGVLSFIVERHIGDMSVRMNLGYLYGRSRESRVYTLAMSVNKYSNTFYKGIGVLMGVRMIEKWKPKLQAAFLNVPLGLDGRFGNGHALVREIDLNWGVVAKKETGRPEKLRKAAFPLPGCYYKYRL